MKFMLVVWLAHNFGGWGWNIWSHNYKPGTDRKSIPSSLSWDREKSPESDGNKICCIGKEALCLVAPGSTQVSRSSRTMAHFFSFHPVSSLQIYTWRLGTHRFVGHHLSVIMSVSSQTFLLIIIIYILIQVSTGSKKSV